MEYVYAAMLLHSAGKPISEENLASVLKAAKVEPDQTRIKALTASLEGVNIDEVVSKGLAMMTSAPAAAPAEAKEDKKDDKKKEEKKKEEKVSEEEAAAGLGALFG